MELDIQENFPHDAGGISKPPACLTNHNQQKLVVWHKKQLMNCGKSCKKPRTNFASRTMKDQDLLVEQRNKP